MEGLNSHPDIDCWFEYFSVLNKRGASGPDQLAWFREFVEESKSGTGKVRGFKTKLKDVLDREGFHESLKTSDTLIVHMQRSNVVKQTVSFFNSMRLHDQTGDWNLYDADRELGTLVVNAEKFDEWLKATARQAKEEERFLSTLPNRILSINYEEMLRDERRIFGRVFSFVGVAPREVKGKALKVSSDRLRDVLGNFNELYSRYKGTPYQSMFDEIEVTQ